MEAHVSELGIFVGENVFIRFLHGSQERSKEAFIRKFSAFRLFVEGLHDPSGRTYRLRILQILEIKSLENTEKIWRKDGNGRI